MDTALLIINAQVNMLESEPVYRASEMLAILRLLIERARNNQTPVIFIRNNGGLEHPDKPHSVGWSIHPGLAPIEDESIVDKFTPDSFYRTNLAGILAKRGIRRLVIAGMQTEYCIDTTCRQAFSLDYSVTLVADAHSTYPDQLPAEDIITHHNRVLSAFAQVRPAAEIVLGHPSLPTFELDALTNADRAAIKAGLTEWEEYEAWLAKGMGIPYWPHTHPGRVVDVLRQMWEPAFNPHGRYLDPPRWEVGIARTFMQPLENIPPAFRKSNLQAVKGAIDHLLQNPRNPLSTQIRPLHEQLWLYDSRDLRLFYVPHVTHDQEGRERHYVFLVWLSPGVPVRNPFAM